MDTQALIEKLQTLSPDAQQEVVDFIDFIAERRRAEPQKTTPEKRPPLNFPVDSCGSWPEGLSLRREDIYGDDGR